MTFRLSGCLLPAATHTFLSPMPSTLISILCNLAVFMCQFIWLMAYPRAPTISRSLRPETEAVSRERISGITQLVGDCVFVLGRTRRVSDGHCREHAQVAALARCTADKWNYRVAAAVDRIVSLGNRCERYTRRSCGRGRGGGGFLPDL